MELRTIGSSVVWDEDLHPSCVPKLYHTTTCHQRTTISNSNSNSNSATPYGHHRSNSNSKELGRTLGIMGEDAGDGFMGTREQVVETKETYPEQQARKVTARAGETYGE